MLHTRTATDKKSKKRDSNFIGCSCSDPARSVMAAEYDCSGVGGLIRQLGARGYIKISLAVVGEVGSFGKEVERGAVPGERRRSIEGRGVYDGAHVYWSGPLVCSRCASGDPNVLAANASGPARRDEHLKTVFADCGAG